MPTGDILIYVGTFAAAIVIFFVVRWAATKFGGRNLALAQTAFASLPGFAAKHMLIYLDSAVAYDDARKRIAIWEKASGARQVEPAEVGAWHSGVLLSVVLSRTTATPMLQLYPAADAARPFFKVGVLDARQCPVWATRLATAFGAEKDRETAVRVLGLE